MSDHDCRATGGLPVHSSLWGAPDEPGRLANPFAPTCEATGYEDLDAVTPGPANADPFFGIYDHLHLSHQGRLPGQQMPIYGYVADVLDENGQVVGRSGGAGLDHDDEGPITHDLFSVNAQGGELLRGGEGVHIDGQVARFGVQPGEETAPVGVDGSVLAAQLDASASDTTAGFGAQAELVSGAVTIGDEANSVRFGGSLGGGFGARVHYGDADGDGIQEQGFGLDVGPFSFDVRTELLSEIASVLDVGPYYGEPSPEINPGRPHPVTGISAPDRDYTPTGQVLWR